MNPKEMLRKAWQFIQMNPKVLIIVGVVIALFGLALTLMSTKQAEKSNEKKP